MINTEQEEVVQWLDRLEEIAAQKHMKSRFLDAIRDCRKEWEQELTKQERQAKYPELEKLLNQMKNKISPHTEEDSLTDDIAGKASEIISRCRNSNVLLQKEYSIGASTYIEEAERTLEGLSNVEASYDEVTNQDRFLNVFHTVGQKYRLQVDQFQEQYVKAANKNYLTAFERLKTLLSSTGYDREAERRFYQTYYENQDSLTKSIESYARNTEKGESGIVKLGEVLQEPIQRMIKRLKRKAFLQKLIPAMLILIIVLLSVVFNIAQDQGNMSQVQTEAEGREENTGGIINNVTERITDRVADGIVKLIPELSLMILFPIILLLAVCYWFWCRRATKNYRNWIIREAGSLLEASIEKWRQEKKLALAVEESFQMTDAYINKLYDEMLSELICKNEGRRTEDTEFIRICTDWENIRRKVEG